MTQPDLPRTPDETLPLTADVTFAIIPTWVLDADVSAQAVRLYGILRRYADVHGYAYPSRRTLAERLHVKDVQTVDRALTELTELGAVEVVPRFQDGRQVTSGYVLLSTRKGGRGMHAPPEGHQSHKGRGMGAPQNESHKNETPPSVVDSTQPQRRTASRLPQDWTPEGEPAAYAEQQGFTRTQIARMAMDFRDYWTAKPGKDGTKLDWVATWRTWVRREADRRGIQPRTAPQTAPTTVIDPVAIARRRREEQEARLRADQEAQLARLAQMDAR